MANKGELLTASAYKDLLKRRIEAAQGIIPCDLVLKHCRIVDVYTQSIREGDIAIIDGVLAGIGGSYEGRRVVDAGRRYAAPGLIDSHIHIESSYVSPEEFGRLVVPRGTTTIIADPHEIANVCGLAGLQYMAEAAEQTVLDIQFMAPSCVPATAFDHSGAVIGAEELARALQDRHILGVGEFMNYPGVTAAQDDVLDKLAAAHEAGKLVDGHSPGLHGGGLQAYAAAGIRTDHECSTAEEALERISLGMYVLLRNGSACRDLPNLIGAVTLLPTSCA
ncbi:Adenine deaminase [uncultured Megasphaera sp.]|nr:Adenine deaminase [uncultured Megasphaera sp.]SCJ47182.1 Adenine deaminase [uncultured Ruminococcus sp.]